MDVGALGKDAEGHVQVEHNGNGLAVLDGRLKRGLADGRYRVLVQAEADGAADSHFADLAVGSDDGMILGHAGHAGTAPMTLRRDAIAGAAAAILAVEDVCVHGSPDLRGTVGRVLPATAAYNVIAGEAEIGVDVRAATEAARDEAVRAIGARFETIASARGLGLDFTVIQDLPATRCDPVLMKVMGDAVAGQGLPLLETLSGAGHDAAVMAKLAPIVMLFIRCEGGISHNPLESVADDDVDVAVRVLGDFIERLALEAA